MTNLTFSQNLALALYSSEENFPIDLDDAWQWLGYNQKSDALSTLKNNFEKDTDFSASSLKSPSGGRPRQCIMLSIDCFKSMGMMAGTEQGKAIRRYFLECERIAKQAIATLQLSGLFLEQSRCLTQLTNLENQATRLKNDIAAHENAIAELRQKLETVEIESADIYTQICQPLRQKAEQYEDRRLEIISRNLSKA